MRLSVLLLLAFASPVFAFPQLLSLDGFLTNSSGSALNSSYSFVFSLYNVSSGGSALWTETQNLAVSSGKLNALLGSVTALNLPFDQDYYLGINVNSDGEMSPRYRIASSAYAYTAKNLAPNASAMGSLRLSNDTSACANNNAGALRWTGDTLSLCDGTVWKALYQIGLGNGTTGGTITTISGYRVHTFLSNGTFTPDKPGTVEYLIVGGGGSGGDDISGGGGAGGFLTGTTTVTAQSYAIVVGAGGAATTGTEATGLGNSGSPSSFNSIIALGGGAGAGEGQTTGANGSSGGGGGYANGVGGSGTSGQGYNGGNCVGGACGGGGGAGGLGVSGSSPYGGNGGTGKLSTIDGNSYYYAGGGGGSGWTSTTYGGNGGIGGGGGAGGVSNTYVNPGSGNTQGRNNGLNGNIGGNGKGGNAGANTGGGGGGSGETNSGYQSTSGAGGSGIVIIRYPYI